jgi:O-antigen chain-terminating methyltransferase
LTRAIDILQRLASKLTGRGKTQDQFFRLPVQPYGIGDTERCIEIPWAISCYRGERRVLDVGYANAEDRYLDSLKALGIPELYGLDLASKAVQGIHSVVGDVRSAPFRDGVFDLILCISTIEHVGWDNKIYFQGGLSQDPEGDLQAIREMARITKRGGRIVVTVPYGMLHNYGWFQQYDRQRLDRLISTAGCRVLRKDLYAYRQGWRKASEEDLIDVLYKDEGAPAAAGLACLLLEH